MDIPGYIKDSNLAMPEKTWPIFIFLILLFCIFVFLAFQSYQQIDEELTEVALSRRLAIAELSAATLTEKFDRMVGIGVALATRVQFRRLLSDGKWNDAALILKDVSKDFPFIERVHLTSVDGIKMAEIPELQIGLGESFAYRDWYKNVTKTWKPYVSPVFERRSPPKHNIFAVAIPINGEDDKRLGILVIHSDMERFFAWAGDINVGPGGFVFIVDSKGQLAFHPKFPAQGEIINFSEVPSVQKVLQGITSVDITYNPIEKEKRISAYVPVEYGWGVIAQQPVSTAFAFKNKQLQRILNGYALILMFCIVVILLIYRVLNQRSKALVDRRTMSELERRVAERTRQLETTNKELESFSYSVSHDLRSPLRAIEGFSQMLEDDYGNSLDAEGHRLLEVVKNNAKRMSLLIDDLLALSRLGRQSIKLTLINMNEQVNEVYKELLSSSSGHNVESVDLVIHPLPAAKADRALIHQVWTNLLSNALKYSSACPKPVIEIGGHIDGSEIIYYVRDNGAGFDMQYYDKLFTAFQRLHKPEDYPGTGIGLAIIKRVITRHGGRVWAEGKVDEGSVFYFTLPVEVTYD